MASAAWQALCRGLPQTRRQRYFRVSCLPSPWMRGPARQPQPCHAHLSSLPGSVAVVCQHLDSHQPAGATTTPCRPPPRRRQARPMAACITVGQPLAAPQAVGHHTAVDSILHSSVAAGSPGDPDAHRSQGVGSSQGPDAPRLAPGGIRHQAAGRSTQALAQREAADHDSGAVPAALVPWRRSLQPARGHAGATHHPLDSHAPSAAAAVTHNHSLPGLKAGSLPRL